MEPRQMAQGMGIGRAVLGVGFLLMPGPLGRLWVGSKADDGASKLLVRAIGARDVVLGAGILWALSSGGSARRWVEAAAVADAADCTAALLARDSIPGYARAAILLFGGSSAAQGAIAAPKL